MLYKGYRIKKYPKKSVYFGYEILNKENLKTFISVDTIKNCKEKIDKIEK